MPNYQDGKIYTIRNYTDNEMIYVGSTTETLSQRLAKHRSACKYDKKCSLYSHIADNDWSNWYIELYENYPCNNRVELDKKEGEVIRLIGTINKKIAGRTGAEYYMDNLIKIKKYYEENVDKVKEYKKKYYENNKEKICCDICGALLSKQGLTRHQKTIKCMSANNLIFTYIR